MAREDEDWDGTELSNSFGSYSDNDAREYEDWDGTELSNSMAREDEDKDGTDPIYKVKFIPFQNRTVPIVLQNDNGPCPLIAISNVLLLRNQVNLSTDTSEISSSKLLQLIATRLLDTNEVKDDKKGAAYEANLQKNMDDAMHLLPRLRTGIDVNLRFRHIHDFEFTPECAIFDLFDIGLAHGWLFDHQDKETSEVIGSDTYNTLVEKLVALDTSKISGASRPEIEEPTVDFAAATTAALGVPSPMPRDLWSSETSFEEVSNEMNQEELKQSAYDRQRKGGEEEEALLIQALQLSQINAPHGVGTNSVDEGDSEPGRHLSDHGSFSPMSGTSAGSSGHLITPLEEIDMPEEVAEIGAREENSVMHEPGVFTESKSPPSEAPGAAGVLSLTKGVVEPDYVFPTEPINSSSIFALGDEVDRPVNPLDVGEDMFGTQNDSASKDLGLDVHRSSELDVGQPARATVDMDPKGSVEQVDYLNGGIAEPRDHNAEGSSDRVEKESGPASALPHQVLSVGPASCSSSRSFGSSGLDDEEPLYEGEDDFANQGGSTQGDNEPLYEGEIILAEQASVSEPEHPEHLLLGKDKESGSQKLAPPISDHEGEIIRRFLEDNASQLTIYGLFSLAENLKEHELCVFFRNNHFSTLFKRNKQLLLLASDQGYLHQPIVWEQLDSVDGDTIFLKGDFTPFTPDEHNNDAWNVQLAADETANYMSQARTDPDSDLQLAMALQQQELDQQQQQQQQQQLQQQQLSNQQQPRLQGTLYSGPSAPSQPSSHRPAGYGGPARAPAPKPEPKKEKCTIM